MKATLTVTKKFENKVFIFIHTAEVGQTWTLTEAYEASTGQTFVKSTWNKFVKYMKNNTLLSSTEVQD